MPQPRIPLPGIRHSRRHSRSGRHVTSADDLESRLAVLGSGDAEIAGRRLAGALSACPTHNYYISLLDTLPPPHTDGPSSPLGRRYGIDEMKASHRRYQPSSRTAGWCIIPAALTGCRDRATGGCRCICVVRTSATTHTQTGSRSSSRPGLGSGRERRENWLTGSSPASSRPRGRRGRASARIYPRIARIAATRRR